MSIEPKQPDDTGHTSLDTELIQQCLNRFQQQMPLSRHPYAEMASELGITEDQLLALLKQLKDKHIISRVGAVFKPNRVGVSTLAAMAVPEHQLEKIAQIINAYPAVNHNYEREHHFNLWFVVTAENPQKLQQTMDDMQKQTGIVILSLPMEKDYHIDLGFPLQLIQGGQHD